MIFNISTSLILDILFPVFFLTMLFIALRGLRKCKSASSAARRLAPAAAPLLLYAACILPGSASHLGIALAASTILVICELDGIGDRTWLALTASAFIGPLLMFWIGLGKMCCLWFTGLVLVLDFISHHSFLSAVKYLSQRFTAPEVISVSIVSISLFVLLLFAAAGSALCFRAGPAAAWVEFSLAVILDTLFAVQYCRHCAGRDLQLGRKRMSALETAARELQERELLNGPDTCLRTIYCRFLELMEEKELFLDPQLNVNDAARMIFTNRNYLGKAISIYSGKNFCSLVNTYRIRYAVDAFRKNPYLRIGQLVDMCGFRTPGAFTLAFRLEMKKSPSEWCSEYRESHAK